MSLRFPYAQLPSARLPATSGGRTRRPRPLIGVTLLGPQGSRWISGLLDTGSDDTVFSGTLAAPIGIDLSNAPQGTSAGVGGVTHTVRFAEVTIRIADHQERREWKAWVGFTSAHLRHALLGYAGFLEYFTITFFGDQDAVELTVNSLFPGT